MSGEYDCADVDGHLRFVLRLSQVFERAVDGYAGVVDENVDVRDVQEGKGVLDDLRGRRRVGDVCLEADGAAGRSGSCTAGGVDFRTEILREFLG